MDEIQQGINEEITRMAASIFKQIPIFTGEKPGEVEEWLETVNVVTELIDNAVTKAQRVAHLRLRMSRTAAKWASTTTPQQRATLAAFIAAIRARFITEADRTRATKQFYEAMQGEHERVLDFLARVQHLRTQVEEATDMVIKGIFEKGLRPEIRAIMEVCIYQDFNGAIRAAENCERLTQQNPTFMGVQTPKKLAAGIALLPQATNSGPTQPHANQNDDMEIGAMQYPRKRKHPNKPKKKTGPKCWNCGGAGHVAKQCPSKKNSGVSRMNIGTTVSTIVEDNKREDNQYSCSVSKDTLLYLHAKIQGRVVKALVDSGATNNFVKETLVNELKLPVKRGPITELRMANGRVEQVNKSAEIEINLEGIIEKHQFVVAGLEFDLVLGLPWLEKEKVTITAKDDSIFTISWNGKEISKDLRLPIPFVFNSEMRRMHKEGAAIFAIYCQRKDDGDSENETPTLSNATEDEVIPSTSQERRSMYNAMAIETRDFQKCIEAMLDKFNDWFETELPP